MEIYGSISLQKLMYMKFSPIVSDYVQTIKVEALMYETEISLKEDILTLKARFANLKVLKVDRYE